MRRREFLAVAAAAALPTRALARSNGAPIRRLGVLTVPAADDPLQKFRVAALADGLAVLGWTVENLSVDWRHTGGDAARIAGCADELVAQAPDVLLAIGSPCAQALRRRTAAIPIVFTIVTDPIGQGFVENLSRPGGNMTGFTDFDLSMGGKWLEMLTQLSPPVATVGVLFNPTSTPLADRMMKTISKSATANGVVARAFSVSDEAGIEAAAATLSQESRAGLLVLPDTFTIVHRAGILRAVTLSRLPTVYWNRAFVGEGGLMSYGCDTNDLHRRPAAYIDRILKGENPGELPVQYPTKFELVVNAKTAAALGIEIPTTLLASATEVIE